MSGESCGTMDPTTGRTPGAGLVPALLRQGPLFNFYRFCQLLEAASPERPGLGLPDTPAGDPVRFRPRPSLGFPTGEIAGVELDPDNPAAPPTVRTTFLGLYGVDARMPWHVLDDIAGRRDGYEPLAAFLDLFNHRVATLYYRVWCKYRYPVGFETGAADRISQSLLCLVGLGFGDVSQHHRLPAARFMALLGQGGQRTRTAEGLAAVVRQVVTDAQVIVEQRHPVQRRIEAPVRIGPSPKVLESGALVLGRHFVDRNSTVRVVIAPPAHYASHALLPGGRDHADLMAMLRVYLGYRLDAELVLRIDPARLPATTLGTSPARMGLTAIAGRSSASRMDIRLGRYCGFAADPGKADAPDCRPVSL